MGLDITSLLTEGDKRTVNNVDTVVSRVVKNKQPVEPLIACMKQENEGLAMRASDAVEKIFAKQPALLKPYVPQLLDVLITRQQKEVRWHLAQILPLLPMTKSQVHQAAKIWLDDFYRSKSSIVRTFSLQAMHDIIAKAPEFRSDYEAAHAYALANGTPAMKSRAKLLLK